MTETAMIENAKTESARTETAKTRLQLSQAIRSARLLTGPHPSRSDLAAACARAAETCPGLAQTAIFAAMSGASEWAAVRARVMAV